MADGENPLRDQLLGLMEGRSGGMSFDEAVADFPEEFLNVEPPGTRYTPWHLIEHLRIGQWDILEYIRNADHVSPKWPDGYWPARNARADRGTWEQSLAAFRADRKALRDLVANQDLDVLTPLPHTGGANVLREVLLVANHNAYHIGEFAALRQVMGTWPAGRESGR